jgi:D-alanyl-lipoteichoic acid acyltransferase DltB (MBOAT superfamily)
MLVASYILYASWGTAFLGLLVLSSAVNYAIGMLLRRQQTAARLWLGVILNVLLLGVFKYIPELTALHSATTLGYAILSKMVMPVGISFWTFQALSYLFDLYRGEDLTPSFLEFLLYMAFWPTVLSGPVCRLSNLLPQFRRRGNPSSKGIWVGLDRIFTGLLMTAVGQTMASGLQTRSGLDAAFNGSFGPLTGADAWVMAIGYGFELFFNFAGYSNLVIGAAQLFGIHLDENFNRPYLSTSPSEFWTRWHMSLSSWIRDYLFFPLVMLRRDKWWRSVVLVLSMIIFGFWHRGTILFGLWGLYHGALLVLHRQWQQVRRSVKNQVAFRWANIFAWPVTFGSICLGWILFRSNSGTQALAMFRAVASPTTYMEHVLPFSLYVLVFVCVTGYFAITGASRLLQRFFLEVTLPVEARMALYAVAFYVALLHTAQTQGFVYFQF